MSNEKTIEVAKEATEVTEVDTPNTDETSTDTVEDSKVAVEKVVRSVKPIQLSDEGIVMFYNSELVNSQTIEFIREILETDANFRDGCHAVLFRNDGPPFEYDAESNKPISALGSYSADSLAVVINLEGIYEKASMDIITGECCESLAAAIYHLINRTAIHELIHGSEYITTMDKYAWTQSPGEENVEELAMLHLIEAAKTSELIELPEFASSEAWIDQKIVETIEAMRSGTGKKEDWEVNQLYMVDNNKVYRSDEEEFGTMREYYRSMADDKNDPCWHQEEKVIVVEPEVSTVESPEAMLGKALLTGDLVAVQKLMATIQATPVVDADVDAGAAVPTDSPFIDIAQVGTPAPGAVKESSLLTEMMANTATFAPQPLSSEEQLVRNIFDLLFNNMFDKCVFKQGHWTNPMAILDPIHITIPGAEQVIHSFDYTNGAGAYIKGELFGGMLKGQLDTRAGKLMRPAYVLHLKVNNIPVTRRLQPVYVLNENGTVRDIAPEKQATSLTFASQQGKQLAILRDPIAQDGVFTMTRQPDGSITWKPWDKKKAKKA